MKLNPAINSTCSKWSASGSRKVHLPVERKCNHHISQELPMLLQGNPSLGNKSTRQVSRRIPHLRPLNKRFRLRQAQAERNQQDRRAGRKPIKRPPAMGRSINERPRKHRSQQIAKRIALLEHTGKNATSSLGTIFESGGSSITIQTAHGDTEKGTHGEELLVGVTEAGAEFEDNEEDVVDDEGPLAAVSVGCDA